MVGDPFGSDELNSNTFGDVEANLRADLAALSSAHPFAETLGAMARRLARSIDQDQIGEPLAGTSRELRQIVTVIASVGGGGEDDFESSLSEPSPSPVRDPKDTG